MGCSGGGPPVAARIEPAGRKVFCVKFQKEMPGLSEVPFEGHPLGQKVYENVSKEGWSMWLEQMKMLMNEYRLNLGTQEAQNLSSNRWTITSSGRAPRFRRDTCRRRRRHDCPKPCGWGEAEGCACHPAEFGALHAPPCIPDNSLMRGVEP